MPKFNKLYTDLYQEFDKLNPLIDYPYPQFKRDSYFPLNGLWKHKVSKKESFDNICEDIVVPYPIESIASGVGKRIKKDDLIIYYKEFTLPNDFIKDKTFIHFLGVDQTFYIILNGVKFDVYETLNLPTVIDITSAVQYNNKLYVVTKDNLNPIYPLGKQSNKPKGLFYTPFSGIYYPVFIESVNEDYIRKIEITTTMDRLLLKIDSTSTNFNITIKKDDKIVVNNLYNKKEIEIKIPDPLLWDYENPHLYDLIIDVGCDKITSYFGLREIKLVENFIYLNNKKIFINGVLDQGYYPEGIITPISYKQYEFDILTMKELGFNTLRKHIKVELPYFYYLCDKLGMLVIQDFVNNGKYNFFKDTALPTLGRQIKNDTKDNKNITQRTNFIKAGESLIKHTRNSCSTIMYTIFNEGWGQFDSTNVYKHFKALFPNLIFDTASGWYRGCETDLDSFHWYFKNIDKIPSLDKPAFISEFGALCYKVENHSYGNRHVFGYKYFDSVNNCEDAFIKLFEEKIIPYKDKLIGTIYTQLSDVEEEDNGLLSYDRKIFKFNKERVKNTLNKLK